MSAFDQQTFCSYPESLVLIEAVPLCRIVGEGRMREDIPDYVPLSDYEVAEEVYPDRSLRSAAIMTCADAFALLKEVGHAAW